MSIPVCQFLLALCEMPVFAPACPVQEEGSPQFQVLGLGRGQDTCSEYGGGTASGHKIHAKKG